MTLTASTVFRVFSTETLETLVLTLTTLSPITSLISFEAGVYTPLSRFIEVIMLSMFTSLPSFSDMRGCSILETALMFA